MGLFDSLDSNPAMMSMLPGVVAAGFSSDPNATQKATAGIQLGQATQEKYDTAAALKAMASHRDPFDGLAAAVQAAPLANPEVLAKGLQAGWGLQKDTALAMLKHTQDLETQKVQNAWQGGENVLNRGNQLAIADKHNEGTLGAAKIHAGATLGAAEMALPYHQATALAALINAQPDNRVLAQMAQWAAMPGGAGMDVQGAMQRMGIGPQGSSLSRSLAEQALKGMGMQMPGAAAPVSPQPPGVPQGSGITPQATPPGQQPLPVDPLNLGIKR